MTCQVKIQSPQLEKTLGKNDFPESWNNNKKKTQKNRKPLNTAMNF